MDKGLDIIDIPQDERLSKNLVQTACKSVKGIQSYPGLYFLKVEGNGIGNVERAIETRGDIRGYTRVEFRSVQ